MNIYSKRMKEFRNKLQKEHLKGAVILPGPNFHYLTSYTVESFERLMCLFIPVDRDPLLLLPELEKERGKEHSAIPDIKTYKDSDDITKVVSSIFRHLNLEKKAILGVEGQMPFSTVQLLEDIVENLQIKNINPILQELRLIKNKKEIEWLRKSSQILEKALTATFEEITPGLAEREIARKVTHKIEDLGGDVPFRLVQSGPNSAIPHHTYGKRKIRKNDVLLLDIGCKYKGYITDITRPVIVGKPSEKIKTIHKIVLKAQKKAITSVNPRIEAQKVDKIAREFIEEKGFERQFIHRTGHGLGLEVHEPPFIKKGNDQQLKPGMVFTVEPGIYLPGEFGIRIEDDIVVTQEGFENLTNLDKDLVRVEV